MCEYANQLPGRIICITTDQGEHYHVYRPEAMRYTALTHLATLLCILGIITLGIALTLGVWTA